MSDEFHEGPKVNQKLVYACIGVVSLCCMALIFLLGLSPIEIIKKTLIYTLAATILSLLVTLFYNFLKGVTGESIKSLGLLFLVIFILILSFQTLKGLSV